MDGDKSIIGVGDVQSGTMAELAELVVVGLEQRELRLSEADREGLWAMAREYFLASRSAATGRAYRKALDLLRDYVGKPWWLISSMDVLDWARLQEGAGLSKATISQRLAGVSSFYEFVKHDFSDDRLTRRDGRRAKLFDDNPADLGQVVRKQWKTNPYGKTRYLNDTQVKALLRAIRRDTVQGLRDYAMIYTYISTGRRNAEVRMLRWGDFSDEGETVFYQWSNKGRVDQRARMPRAAWEAIKAYLLAAGRLDTMLDEDYIFTAESNSIRRLKRADGEQVVSGAWRPGKYPMAGHTVNDRLKRYARKAGLRADTLHVHCLRHTKAMLHIGAGDGDVQKIQRMLGHESLATTQIYIDHLQANQDDGWDKVEALFELNETGLVSNPESRKKSSS